MKLIDHDVFKALQRERIPVDYPRQRLYRRKDEVAVQFARSADHHPSRVAGTHRLECIARLAQQLFAVGDEQHPRKCQRVKGCEIRLAQPRGRDHQGTVLAVGAKSVQFLECEDLNRPRLHRLGIVVGRFQHTHNLGDSAGLIRVDPLRGE